MDKRSLIREANESINLSQADSADTISSIREES